MDTDHTVKDLYAEIREVAKGLRPSADLTASEQLRRLASLQRRIDLATPLLVRALRAKGAGWDHVAACLGVPERQARERYGP